MAHRFNEMASSIGRQRKDRQAFIAGIVHDLRTPLSVLRMSSDVASTGTNLPPERMARVIGTVARQVTRLERMADDLLDSVTIEAGKVTLRTEEVDAREVAADVVDQYRATSSKHTIDLAMPESPVWLSCDRMRIEQVLANLLSNAIKYFARRRPHHLPARAAWRRGGVHRARRGRRHERHGRRDGVRALPPERCPAQPGSGVGPRALHRAAACRGSRGSHRSPDLTRRWLHLRGADPRSEQASARIAQRR